jgi:nitrate/nitrite transporter NarK
MTFKPTILNIATGLFLIGCLFYTLFNYRQLSEGEGWGVVGMVGLLGVGVVLLVIDFIIQKIFKSRKTINIICAIVTIAATLLLLLK